MKHLARFTRSPLGGHAPEASDWSEEFVPPGRPPGNGGVRGYDTQEKRLTP